MVFGVSCPYILNTSENDVKIDSSSFFINKNFIENIEIFDAGEYVSL
jgi:hypothetical protein